MQLSEHPDPVVRHEPSCCAGCEHSLAAAREAGVIRRQVTEIPPVRAEVTEHQLIGRRCNCGRVTWGEAPDGVTAPVQYGPRAAALGATWLCVSGYQHPAGDHDDSVVADHGERPFSGHRAADRLPIAEYARGLGGLVAGRKVC
jgi:transposase